MVGAIVFGGLGDLHGLKSFNGVLQFFAAAHDADVIPHEVAKFLESFGRRTNFLGGRIGGIVPGLGSGRARKCALGLLGDGSIFHHGVAGASTEDQAFEKGIAGQTIGAMNTGESGFARGIEAGDGGASPKIGFDTAHHEVGGGTDGSNVAGKIEAVAEAGGVDAGETLLEELLGFGSHVEIDVLGIGAIHFADDGASDDVARSELLSFVIALHKTLKMDIAEDAAFAAESFAEEETWRAFDGESGGMELDELHVREDGPSVVGNGHAVTGSNFGIGSFAIELAEAASGKKSGFGAEFVERRIVLVEETNACGAAVFDDEFGGEGVSAQMKMRDGVGASEESSADFAASGIAMSVKNARAAVSGFAGKGKLGARAVELGTPFDELGDVARTFFDKKGDGFGIAEAVTGVDGVLFVKADLVFVAEGDGDAALRVGGGGFTEIGFCEDQHTAGLAEFDCGADACYAGAHDEIIDVISFLRESHGCLSRRNRMVTRRMFEIGRGILISER